MDRDGHEYLAATKLAALGFCEIKILKERELGKRRTAEQAAAAERGEREHERFHTVAVESHNQQPQVATDRRCFIATAVYGANDQRTNELRAWRDDSLRRTWFGRAFVHAYYAISPPIAAALVRWPQLQAPVRAVLDGIRHGVAMKGTSRRRK